MKISIRLPSGYISLFSKLIFLLILGLLSVIKPARAQLFDSGEILRAGTEDANTLLMEYLKPFGGGFGADMNSGWFTSAKPLGKFGFDLRVSVSASFVPEKDRLFDVSELNLKTVTLLRGPSETPTAFGDDDLATSTLGSIIDNEEVYSFEMPEGSGYHYVPAPMAQFSLGLPGHSQLTLRYTPTVTIDSEYRFRVFGIGGLLGLNSLFLNDQIPFDLAVQVGYMDLHADAAFEVQPIDDPEVDNPYPESEWDGQGISFNSQSLNTNLLIGKEFSILSVFVGAGYQTATTSIDSRGSYPVIITKSDNSQTNDYSEEILSVNDPVNFTLNGVNKYHLITGIRLNLAFLSFSSSYTFAEYPTFKAGVGIMIGSGN